MFMTYHLIHVISQHTAVFPNVSSPIKPNAPVPSAIQRSALFTCEMPSDFVGKNFAYVFDYLLCSDAILTLGIYRCLPIVVQSPIRIDIPEQNRAVPYGFAYVNPMPHDIMSGNDLIYVLAHKQPCWVS